MQITEVVRGADLLLSTARQLLVYRALGYVPPAFYHCPLVSDEHGIRLAKRHDALSLRTLRQEGVTSERVRESLRAEGVSLQAVLAIRIGERPHPHAPDRAVTIS
jgi:glutamyl-tRNA synthetase